MQIYLIRSSQDTTFQHIEKLLSSLGHTIIVRMADKDLFGNWSDAENHILASDAVIGEGSALSESSMFEIYLAIKADKKTLFLYDKDQENNEMLVELGRVKNKNLTMCVYKNKEDLAKQMLTFVEKVKSNIDAKLFMIIPPNVHRYLEWVARNTSSNKSDIVRSSVERSAKEDKEYQSFLGNVNIAGV